MVTYTVAVVKELQISLKCDMMICAGLHKWQRKFSQKVERI